MELSLKGKNAIVCASSQGLGKAAALDLAKEEGKSFTDEAQAVEHLGGEVDIVLGHTDNIKITFEEDLQLARYFLSSRGEL